MALFRWYQETGGSMGGGSGDDGWGILCNYPGTGLVEGMWWYEAPALRTADPRTALYFWSLRRYEGQNERG
jgi:hypothetical protein